MADTNIHQRSTSCIFYGSSVRVHKRKKGRMDLFIKNPSPRCHPIQDVRESKESWASVYSSENKEKLKDRSKPSWHALSDEAGGPFRGKPAKQGRIQKYNTYSHIHQSRFLVIMKGSSAIKASTLITLSLCTEMNLINFIR